MHYPHFPHLITSGRKASGAAGSVLGKRTPSARFPAVSSGEGTVILASHGSRRQPQVNALVREHAERLRAGHGLGPVAVCFQQGTPHFSHILDLLEPDSAVVIPFFCSDGYYAREVLRTELSKNRSFRDTPVRITSPVGTHPEISNLAGSRVRELIEHFQVSPEETELLVVGHGTRRSRTSRDSTERLVRRLEQFRVCRSCHSAFLDDTPRVEEVWSRIDTPTVMVLPFMIGPGPHVIEDLPARLGTGPAVGKSLPADFDIDGRRLILDRPFGQDLRITALLARLAAGDPTEPDFTGGEADFE